MSDGGSSRLAFAISGNSHQNERGPGGKSDAGDHGPHPPWLTGEAAVLPSALSSAPRRSAPLRSLTPFLETLTDAFTFSPASVVQGQGRYPLPTWRSCSLCVGGWAYSLLQTSFLFQALTVFISLPLSSCRHVRQETVCLQEAASSREQQRATFPV